MTDVGSLGDLASRIASGKYPSIAAYAAAQAKATQSQELEIRKLTDEIAALKAAGTP